MAAASLLKLAMADGYLAASQAPFGSKTSTNRLTTLRKRPINSIRFPHSCSALFFTALVLSPVKKKAPSSVTLVARTSDWARQDNESAEAGTGEEDLEWEGETEEFELSEGGGPEADFSEWEGEDQEGPKDEGDFKAEEGETEEFELSEGGGPEADFSEWEGEDQEGPKDEGDFKAEEDRPGNGEFLEGVGDDSFPEPPEEAKLFVGNLPYDIDSEKLAHLFEKAGVVEVAEVIYNRETGQSRGFGFVSMSNVQEAEKAVEMFSRYDCNGRILTVNIAAPRGSMPERPRRESESSVRIYVGNLPWQVDDTRLEQIFSQHGEVINARVVYDRETGRSRGFGFVTMASKDEHDSAIEALDGHTLDGRAIRVNIAEERPRRGSF